MSANAIAEARRQIEICNACRYCEGYCSVFPAVARQRMFSDADITELASLCHNCRGCFYACQFTDPHEFQLNVPKALAEVRQESWQENAVPGALGKWFHERGVAVAVALVIGFGLLLYAARSLPGDGEGFYAVMSHSAMVAIFAPAFLLPLFSIVFSLRRFWHSVEGESISMSHVHGALKKAFTLKDLSGGHGEGCNFEDEDRFSSARRIHHHLVMYGFLACFASTSVATIMHYVFGLEAPYGFWSLPKLLGVPGGIAICIGTVGLASLKVKADKQLGDARVWGGEMAFVLLLLLVSASGLVLYWFGSSAWLEELLALHLGAVLTFFLLTPYSKMVHGFYRVAAYVRDEQKKAA